MGVLIDIIANILGMVFEISFDIGFFIYDRLHIKTDKTSKKEFSMIKRILISILGFMVSFVVILFITIYSIKLFS